MSHTHENRTSTARRALAGTAAVATGAVLAAGPALSAPADAAGTHHHVFRAKVVKIARHQKGDSYAYGADGPSHFDCSGLVKYVFKKAGRHLPRTSSAQYHAVKHISRKHSRAGDLVFFKDDGHVYHVGIKTGKNRMIDAAHPGTKVRTEPIWSKKVSFGRG